MRLDRRALAGAALGCAMWPLASRGQARRKLLRIGILGLNPTAEIEGPQPRSPQVAMLLRGLRELGYVYGEHYVTLAYGVTGHRLGMAELVADLVRQRPDVIVATGAACAPLKRATSSIPVVMTAALDPVGTGLVNSLVRPGGNLTGMSLQGSESSGKRLELLKAVVPGPEPVGVIWNQVSLNSWQAARVAEQERGWRLTSHEINDGAEWQAAFRAAASAKASGLLVMAAQVLFARAKSVAELVAKLKLPAMYELRPYVEAGGLMCYGLDIVDIWRRAAFYVDKILDGANPADLPIEQPTRFEFVVNQRVARELGITLPQLLLLRADEVIS